MMKSLEERFWSKVDIPLDKDGNPDVEKHWMWVAYVDNKGYGLFCINGKPLRTHRAAYFLKNEQISDVMQRQAELDVRIFANYIVPVLGIKKRYVGTEYACKTTEAYNLAMKAILPSAGVEVVEVIRKAISVSADNLPDFISASKVREAIRSEKLEEVLDFLPDSTRDFLFSDDSLIIRDKIKAGKGRH